MTKDAEYWRWQYETEFGRRVDAETKLAFLRETAEAWKCCDGHPNHPGAIANEWRSVAGEILALRKPAWGSPPPPDKMPVKVKIVRCRRAHR